MNQGINRVYGDNDNIGSEREILLKNISAQLNINKKYD